MGRCPDGSLVWCRELRRSCRLLAGVCEPFDAATLDRLYPGGKREYLNKFEASLASAIKAGFILPADRQEILALATATVYRGSH